MRRFYILFLSIIFSSIGFSQNPFNKVYGSVNDDGVLGISKINDDTICFSYISDGSGSNTQFSKCLFFDSNCDSIFSSNSFNGFSDYFINTSFKNTIASTGRYISNGNVDISLNLYNFKNNQIISKNFGGLDDEVGYDIKQTVDSGFIIIGFTRSFGGAYEDIYIVRTDKNGDSLWTKVIESGGFDIAKSIKQKNDSTYLICGTTSGFGAYWSDPFIMEINLSGDTSNLKLYHRSGNFVANSMCKTTDMGYAITGWLLDGSYNGQFFLLKIDSNYNKTSLNTYGNLSMEEAYDIKQCIDGGFIMVGYTEENNRDLLIIRTNNMGDTIWTKRLGGQYRDQAYQAVQLSDSSYLIAGNTFSYGNGGSDAFLLKLKPNGDLTTSIGLEISPKYLEAKVFPNPISEEFNLKIDNYSGEMQMEVVDISGKSIYKENLNVDYNFQKSFKLKNLSSGVYSISLKGDNFEKALKLVVE